MRPLTRAKVLENQRFLRELANIGNAHAAADACRLKITTMYARRRRDPAFAAEWDAAKVVADAHAREPARRGEPGRRGTVREGAAPAGYHKVRLSNGRVQLRRIRAGGLDSAGEQRFLQALSATCNVQLEARAAGYQPGSLYQRAAIDPGFAREWRLALQTGYERLEFALIHGFTAGSHTDDGWRHNDPPAIPPMTAEQALQALTLHRKTAQLWQTRPWERRRPGESTDQWSARMAAIARARARRAFEDAEVARAAGREPEPPTRYEGDMATYALAEKLRAEVLAAAPPKAQPGVGTVRWAKAAKRRRAAAAVDGGEGKAEAGTAQERQQRVRRTGQAMFGGWRIERKD